MDKVVKAIVIGILTVIVEILSKGGDSEDGNE